MYLNFSNLKLFNLGLKEKIVKGTIGFTENSMWMVDGVSKYNPKGKLNNKNLAYWWNTYLKENIELEENLLGLVNKGLQSLKQTEFWDTELAVSLVIIKDKGEDLDILLIGDCEVILGKNKKLSKLIKSNNFNITKNFISEMQEISKNEHKDILETREDIEEELTKHIRGEAEEPYILLRCKYNYVTEQDVVLESVKKNTITHISVYNSGVSRYYNTFKLGGLEDLYRKSIDATDYMSIYECISNKEKEDIMCEKYPRIKPAKGCMLISVGV